MSSKLAIFDLDRTLTRQPTYSKFLLYALIRRLPWRVVALPILMPLSVAYILKLVSRKRMKEAMHRIALGTRLERQTANALAEAFAASLVARGVYSQAFERIAAEKAEGRRVVLATAAPDFYAAPFARLMGIEALLATRSTWRNDNLGHEIDGENCYGPAKLVAIEAWLQSQNIDRKKVHVRFFSDHASDRPTFEWADEPIMVNPSRKLQKIGKDRGWASLDWRTTKSRVPNNDS